MTTATAPNGHATTQATPTDAWMAHGLCREVGADLFFPEGRGGAVAAQTAQAKQICGGCRVRQLCLEWALETGQNTGVWGGLSEDERYSLIRKPDPTMTRCLNRQAWIESELEAGRSQKAIAAELGVDHGVLNRAVQRFRAEAQGEALEEVSEA